jgi:hypothetical protein
MTKLAKVSARFSKSLAGRGFRPNQEKVRSTTQRRGRTTKPFLSSLRFTISTRSVGTLAPPSAFSTEITVEPRGRECAPRNRLLGQAPQRVRPLTERLTRPHKRLIFVLRFVPLIGFIACWI